MGDYMRRDGPRSKAQNRAAVQQLKMVSLFAQGDISSCAYRFPARPCFFWSCFYFCSTSRHLRWSPPLLCLLQIGQSHQTGLTNSLLKLFEPRPMPEFKPPLQKRKMPPLTGMPRGAPPCLWCLSSIAVTPFLQATTRNAGRIR